MSNSNSAKGGNRSTPSPGSVWTPFELPRLQPEAVDLLRRSYAHDRIGSAWLISGQPGFGQWPTALWLAALLNCTGKEAPPADIFAATSIDSMPATDAVRPCGECTVCRQIAAVHHTSLVIALPVPSTKNQEEFTEAQSEALEQRRSEPFALREHTRAISIAIDAIRFLRRRLSLQAELSGTRVVILDEIERSRSEAIDALLKLLEEPPDRTIFVLTTSAARVLAPTIHSRVRALSLRPIAHAAIDEFLLTKGIADESSRAQIIRWSRGSLGEASSLSRSDDDGLMVRDAAETFLTQTFTTNPGVVLAQLSRLFPEFGAPDTFRQRALKFICALQQLLDESLQHSVRNSASKQHEQIYRSLQAPWRVRRLTELLENTLDDIHRNVHIRTMIFAFHIRWREIFSGASSDSASVTSNRLPETGRGI